jgi:hypothetical protein
VSEDADTTEATQALDKFSLQMTSSAILSSRAWLQPRDRVLDAVEKWRVVRAADDSLRLHHQPREGVPLRLTDVC